MKHLELPGDINAAYVVLGIFFTVCSCIYVCIHVYLCARAAEWRDRRGIAPQFFQICALGGLASPCLNLGTQACNTTHIIIFKYKADI